MGLFGRTGKDVKESLEGVEKHLAEVKEIVERVITDNSLKQIKLEPQDEKTLRTSLSELIGKANSLSENCRHIFFKG